MLSPSDPPAGARAPESARFTRRWALIGGGAATLFALGGCDLATLSPGPSPVDELKSQEELARRDAALAEEAATALDSGAGAADAGATAAALTQVAVERDAHARAFSDEIARTARTAAPERTDENRHSGFGADTPPTVDDVIVALRESADSAGRLAVTLSGYRAGLLASVAAACTVAHTVVLAGPGG